jgi:hypothetical protein
MDEPLLHIGYPKTGTTWLQRHLFDNRQLGFQRANVGLIRERFTGGNPFDFDAEACRAALRPEIEQALAVGCRPVFSYERLTGHAFFGGYDARTLADRLHAAYPRARVLVVIREQRSVIYSGYQQYVRGGGGLGLRGYLRPPCRPRRVAPGFRLDYYAYHHLIGYYRGLFGAAGVLVLPFEKFRQEPVAFVEEVCRFAEVQAPADAVRSLPYGSKANAGMRPLTVALTRRLNQLFARTEFNPAPPVPLPESLRRAPGLFAEAVSRLAPASLHRWVERRMKGIVAAAVQGVYEASNDCTSRLIGIDLSSYGYARTEAARRADEGRQAA